MKRLVKYDQGLYFDLMNDFIIRRFDREENRRRRDEYEMLVCRLFVDCYVFIVNCLATTPWSAPAPAQPMLLFLHTFINVYEID